MSWRKSIWPSASTVSEFDWLGVPSLELAPLAALSAARQRNALSHWLAALTRLPDSDHWSGWDDLRDAAADARPIWRLADGELHRAGGRIWWLSGGWLRPAADAGELARSLATAGVAGQRRAQFQRSNPRWPAANPLS